MPANGQPAPFLYGAARLGEASAPRALPGAAIDVSIEAGVFQTGALVTVPGAPSSMVSLAGAMSARARFGSAGIEVDVPGEHGSGSPYIEPSYTLVGNPSATVFVVGDLGLDALRLTLRAGLGVAIPNVPISPPPRFDVFFAGSAADDFYYLRSLFVAGLQSGLWQYYRYRFGPNASLFLPVGAEGWIDRLGYVALEGLLTGQWLGAAQSWELAFAAEGGIEPWPWLRLSARIVGLGVLAPQGYRSIYYFALAHRDFELSVEPRVTLAFGPFFARAGVLFNVEGLWGFDGAITGLTYPIWSARGALGVRF